MHIYRHIYAYTYVYNGILFPFKNGNSVVVTIRMNLEHIMLSEIGHLQTGAYYMIPLLEAFKIVELIETDDRMLVYRA